MNAPAIRAIIGPESQMAFDVYGTKGAVGWNLEQLNELQVSLVDEAGAAPRGYTTVYGGDRYPYHGRFVPTRTRTIHSLAVILTDAAGTNGDITSLGI